MTRAAADLDLAHEIAIALPEFSALIARLHNDRFLSSEDSKLVLAVRELLQGAAGRLMLRVAQ